MCAGTIGGMASERPHIGTLREKPLHASLKDWYAQAGDLIEVPVDGYVIDIVRDDLLIEIQTRGFSSMKGKVEALLAAGHRLRIVHPVAVDRTIVRVGDDGTILGRRRSPKHGDAVDLFSELVSFPALVGHSGLEFEVVLTDQEEYRRHVPGKAWRRKGWTVMERRLAHVHRSVRITSRHDLTGLLPGGLPETFTTADLASALGRSRRSAQQMAYCLREAGCLVVVGKRANAIAYQVA